MDWETGVKRGPFSETQIKLLSELVPGLDAGQVQWLCGYLTGIGPLIQKATPSAAEKQLTNNGSQVSKSAPVRILYGTHTGNSERLAKQSAKRISALGLETKVSDMGSFKVRELRDIKRVLIIVSTDGEGEPPVQAEEFLKFLRSSKAPALNHMVYSILALGDTSYTQFCQTGKDFDAVLEKLGAGRISNRIDCDVDFEDDYERWIKEILSNLTQPSIGTDGVLVNHAESAEGKSTNEVVYTRKNPFPATVLNKINLNGRHSSKETIHLELDLKGSQLRYEPGDALGIYALNSKKIIELVLGLLRFSGEEVVETHQGKKNLLEALRSDYELTPLTNVSLTRYADLTGSSRLKNITTNNALIAEYLYGRDIYDLLKEEPFELSPDTFISLLRKNTPRMYSIASSQDNVADEVHVAVSVVRYEALGRRKEGHCSSFLLDRIGVDDQVKVFIDPNTRFKLPSDVHRPIIMVGPGTGVAPFRAFLQQREVQENAGKSWLFFGERNFTTDFLYQTEWLQYLKEGILTRADVAFSRDQQRKIYVQHKMQEQGKELFNWLEDGAHFYVCGDKQHMAKDVDQTLKRIIQTHGGMTEEKAAEYVKSLQAADRYQTDVY